METKTFISSSHNFFDSFEPMAKRLDKVIKDQGATEIYSLKDDHDKIVKITFGLSEVEIEKLFVKLNLFKEAPWHILVKLFNYEFIGYNLLRQKEPLYYIMMEKLEPVSYQEYQDLVRGFHHFGWSNRNPDPEYQLTPQIKLFIEQYYNSPYTYDDWHDGNIMKNKDGDYKLIDLESLHFVQVGQNKWTP